MTGALPAGLLPPTHPQSWQTQRMREWLPLGPPAASMSLALLALLLRLVLPHPVSMAGLALCPGLSADQTVVLQWHVITAACICLPSPALHLLPCALCALPVLGNTWVSTMILPVGSLVSRKWLQYFEAETLWKGAVHMHSVDLEGI